MTACHGARDRAGLAGRRHGPSEGARCTRSKEPWCRVVQPGAGLFRFADLFEAGLPMRRAGSERGTPTRLPPAAELSRGGSPSPSCKHLQQLRDQSTGHRVLHRPQPVQAHAHIQPATRPSNPAKPATTTSTNGSSVKALPYDLLIGKCVCLRTRAPGREAL